MQCEQINQHRQQLCADIEQEAIAWVESSRIDLQRERVLVVVQPEWHHGVIGIVASRLVERYGVPVFIGTYEDEERQVVRGSARGIPEFNVFEALQACDDLFEKYGGHPAAGGFSLPADRLDEMRSRLSQFANECLTIEHLKPLVKIDAQADLRDLDLEFYQQIDRLQPCGIENDPPVFWTPNVRLLEQRIIGKGHIKTTVAPAGEDDPAATLKAIAWRWDDYFPLPACVDVAYKLRENRWNGNTTVELEIVGARLSAEVAGSRQNPELATTPAAETAPAEPPAPDKTNGATPQPQTTQFYHNQRYYQCGVYPIGDRLELRIRNDRDCVLAVRQGDRTGLLGSQRDNAVPVDVSQPHYYQLIKTAMQALGLNKK
jgi:single-stranded-DNA-specific exonuclease